MSRKDESPSVINNIGVEETMEIFNNLSPRSCAKMVSIAVDNECKIAGKLVLSPNHASLIEQHQTIEMLTVNCPARAQQLKEISIEKYIVNKRDIIERGGVPARKLHFEPNGIGEKGNRPVIVSKNSVINKQYSVTEKKRKRKNVRWKNITIEDFSNMTQCKVHIRELYPSLRVKETKSKGESTLTKYQCYENSIIKNSKRGSCYAIMNATPASDNETVKLQVTMDPLCVCRNDGHIKKPQGLPQSIKDEVHNLLENVAGIQPQQIKNNILKKIVDGELDTHNSIEIGQIETSNVQRKLIVKQINNMSTHQKKKCKKNGTLPAYVHYVQDLVNIRSLHTFNPPSCMPPVTYNTEESLQTLGVLLYKLRSLKIIKPKEIQQTQRNAFRLMTFLDPQQNVGDVNTTLPEINLYSAIEKWRTETRDTEVIEGDPYHTTSCFSSLSLLWNIKECERLGFNVCCSADGTDKTTSTNYQLLSFGTYNRDRKGVQSYRPFFYILGPGERRVTFAIGMVAFLKYARLIFGIRNIQFRGPCISDHSSVFVSVYEIAFPSSTKANCWIHILRRFTTGKGNGAYIKKGKDKNFVRTIAKEDVRKLHNCLSHQQFVTMGKLVIAAWMEKGEHDLATVFNEQYLLNEKYNRWTVNTTGENGFDASQNAMERSNSEVKGTRVYAGAVRPGKDIGTMLMTEFPNMILQFSINRIGVEKHIKLLSEDVIFQSQSDINNDLMRYYSLYQHELDCKILRPENGDNITVIVNTLDFLGLPVTDERYCEYELGLKGKTGYSHHERNEYSNTVSSLCKVHGVKLDNTNTVTYHGSCSDYCRETYCHHSAIFQYSERLISHGKAVPRNRQRWRSFNKQGSIPHPIRVLKSKYMLIAETMDDMKSKIMKYSGNKNEKSIGTNTLVRKLAGMPNIIERWNIVKSKSTTNKILQLTQISNRCIVTILDVKRYIWKLDEFVDIHHDDIIEKIISMCPLLLSNIELL